MNQLLNDTLNYIDLFGLYLTFRNNGYSRFRTRLGGVITILFFIACIIFFINTSEDMFYKTNPKVRTSLHYKENAIVESNDYTFALYFSNSSMRNPNYKLNKTIHDFIEFYAVLKTRLHNNTVEEKITFIKCDFTNNKNAILSENIFYNNGKTKLQERLNNTYCLNKKNSTDLFLQNSLNEIPNKSLSIYVKRKISNEGNKKN